MALQSSGAISLANIQTEFGGSNPIGLNEYYGAATGVPASGTISIDDFYGTSNAQYITATGGTITTDGDYKVHTFTGSGSFSVSNAGNAAGNNVLEYLIIAGGGGGGGRFASGGGGAGGYRTASGQTVSATNYTITVGAGGGGGGSDGSGYGPASEGGGVGGYRYPITAGTGGTANTGGGGGGAPGGGATIPGGPGGSGVVIIRYKFQN